ncbi:hypothetical protein M419DRAFT_89116 [Trichoderma reesei RUT C-30]|uniref:Hypervirulence associated protein TUDOR domain-containing protein n=2 Tax=Hypocrea jecorina TaxID=51453 RepID=A0A024RZM8_HYPJR|nr:hypothetical protein M419DRAFT_89116 [Trichoderma reesei RUT C-30]
MKEKNEVIQEFKELVNMTAQELKEWLKGDDSTSAGWSKDDGSGESVGHDSGRRIVEILESNPDKDPEKYTDDDISHMRKVVSYCKRHLAQEERANSKKSVEEVKKTKSYASLKNWGHDPLKKRQANGGGAKDKADDKEEDKEEEGKDDKAEEKEEKAGEKRKAKDDQSGKSKKRETEDGAAEVKDDEDKDEQEEDAEKEQPNEKDSSGKEKKNGQQNGKGSGKGDTSKGPKEGDTVSWNWGQGQPEGKVKEVNPDETTVQTKKGSKVTRKGDEEDPAVVLDTGKTDAVKLNHELNETED